MSYHVDVDATEVLVMLERADRAISNANIARALTGTVAEYMQERARERFAVEGDDASGKWAPLSWATIKMRQEAGYGSGPINRRTGEMYDWLTSANGELFSSGDNVLLMWPDTEFPGGELGKKLEHAQAGAEDPPTVPRPVIAANEEDLLGVMTRLGTEIFSDMGVVGI
jgi:phage gpG-like protein